MGNPLGLVPAPSFFGVDVQSQLDEWWWSVGEEEFFAAHPDERGKNYFAIILDPGGYRHHWRMPLMGPSYFLTNVRGSELLHPTGTPSNVAGKLAFVLRTGLDSIEAETRRDLWLPGDFPAEGAGKTNGYFGGVSGFAKKTDTVLRLRLTEKLMALRAAAAEPVFEAAKSRTPDTKYLGDDPLAYLRSRAA